jgi:murein DD-endopeptidase MepM/ murein hydrolase activator NlpD
VRQGDNLHKISRLYGMNINDLIKINNLSKPYNIFSGSKLRISNSSFKSKSRKAISQRNLKSTKLRVKKSKLPYKNNKFIWPIKGNVISNFGQKPGGLYNDGINIKARNSAPVQAVEDGLVAYVGNELRGYGNLIIIKHSKGWVSAYAHLEKTNVRTGSKVKQGQIIANVGSTGNVKSSQLYFGIRKGRQAVNPKLYLN